MNGDYINPVFSVNPVNTRDFYITTTQAAGNFTLAGPLGIGQTQTGILSYDVPQGFTALLRNVMWDWDIVVNELSFVNTQVFLFTDDVSLELKGTGFLEYSDGFVPLVAYAYRNITIKVIRTSLFFAATGIFFNSDRFNAIFNGNLIPNDSLAVNKSMFKRGVKYAIE